MTRVLGSVRSTTLRVAPVLVAAVLGAAAVLLAAPPDAAAQSLFNAAGLGYPINGVDGRAAALGSSGVGLFEPILIPAFAAGSADLVRPTVTGTLQSTWGTPQTEGLEGDVQGNRFPMLGIAYPVRRVGVASVTFEGVMDQRWRVSRESSVQLSGEEVRVLDRFVSDGGISAVRLGWGQRLGDDLAVGVSLGYHVGNVSRTFTRTFDTLAVGSQVNPFRQEGRWQFGGPTASAGFLWDAGEILRVGGSLVWSGTLEGEPESGDAVEAREFDLPLRFRAGASVVLAPDLALSTAVSYADWSDAADDLVSGVGTGPAWELGAGIEWEGPRFLDRDFPVRIGYRRADLPFGLEGGDAVESAFSAGLGITLAQSEELPLARIEAMVQRGTREDDAFTETFWRAGVTLQLSGR